MYQTIEEIWTPVVQPITIESEIIKNWPGITPTPKMIKLFIKNQIV